MVEKVERMEEVKEQVALEQFLDTLPIEKKAWVRDKVAAGELTDDYEEARKLRYTSEG